MKNFTNQAIWFASGFAIGLTLITVGHAALAPTPTYNNNGIVTEMKTGRVSAPDLDQDYSRLNNAEAKYAESWDQQQRLRTATSQVAGGGAPLPKKRKINQ